MTHSKRAHERFECELPVVVTVGSRTVSCSTRNVSVGGMFVACPELVKFGEPDAIRFGDAIAIKVRLPALREDSTLEGRVRWVTPDGFGVQFGSLRAIEVWALNQLMRHVG